MDAGFASGSSYRSENGQTRGKYQMNKFPHKKKHIYFDDDKLESDIHEEEEEMEEEESDNDEEEEDDDEDEDDEEEETNQKDYSQMSMEELLKLQEKIGTKDFNRKVLKEGSQRVVHGPKYYSRTNKNRPPEMPLMRRRAPRMRYLDPHQKTKKTIQRDPRFDDLSGRLDMREWEHKYQFISELRKKEKEVLKRELTKEDSEDMKKRIESIVQRMENQERQKKFEQKEKEVEKEIRQEQMSALRQGVKPKYVTNKEKKLRVRAKHFETLKQENRVDKYMKKQEKKQRMKEMRERGAF